MKHLNLLLFAILSIFLFTNCSNEKSSNEKSSWENACLTDSTAAYEEFLKSFPNGEFADSAKLKIEGRQLLIYTIPSGLNIYFSKVDTNITNLNELGGKWVKIYNKSKDKHYLIDENNLKGKSPIVLNDIKSGKYVFAVEPVEFYNKEMKSQNMDPFLKPLALVSSFEINLEMINKFKSGEIDLDGAIIYYHEKLKDKKEIIIIYAKDDISWDELANSYPKENNFKFDIQKLQAELKDKNFHTVFSDDETKITLDLLQRGSKVAVQKGDIKFLIQVMDKNQFNIETLGRIN